MTKSITKDAPGIYSVWAIMGLLMIGMFGGLLLGGWLSTTIRAQPSSRVYLERIQRGSDAVLIVRDDGDKIIGVVSACR